MLHKLKSMAIAGWEKLKAVSGKTLVWVSLVIAGGLGVLTVATPSASAYTISPTNVFESGSWAVAKAAVMEWVEKTIDVWVDTAYTGWNFSLDVVIQYLVWFIMLWIVGYLAFRIKRRLRL